MTETLILDKDGLFDPATFHDRLLLGLYVMQTSSERSEREFHIMKRTMREAELHVLRGGILTQAQRVARKLPLPVGLVSAEDDMVILDPDAHMQQALRVLCATFKRTGSA